MALGSLEPATFHTNAHEWPEAVWSSKVKPSVHPVGSVIVGRAFEPKSNTIKIVRPCGIREGSVTLHGEAQELCGLRIEVEYWGKPGVSKSACSSRTA